MSKDINIEDLERAVEIIHKNSLQPIPDTVFIGPASEESFFGKVVCCGKSVLIEEKDKAQVKCLGCRKIYSVELKKELLEPTFSDPKDFVPIKGVRFRQPKWAGPIGYYPNKTRDECSDEDEWEYERDKVEVEYADCLQCKREVVAPRRMDNFKACPHCGYCPEKKGVRK